MKSKIFKIIGALVLITWLFINFNWRRSKENSSDILLKNVFAIAQAQAEGGSSGTWTCYSTYNNCWFWNCSTIYRCGNPCTSVSADDWSNNGVCSAI
jgi:hypothetical protein